MDNWWVVVSCMLLSAILAYLYSYKQPKIYAASTQLLLGTDDIIPVGQNEFSGTWMAYQKISNEKRILTSSDLIEQTIQKLKLDVSYYIVGRIQTKRVYEGMPFAVEGRIYTYTFYDKPFTLKIIDEKMFELSFENEDKSITLKHPFDEPLINNDFYVLVRRGGSLNAITAQTLKEITYQFKIHDISNLIYHYKEALSVQDVEWTHILQVTLKDENPESAMRFLDTLTYLYMQNSLKSKIQVNENTIRYIDRHLAEVVNIL
ncbi:MAG: Wzz/FepE/Etk N-terminal domain-containing protein, partial [Candidatus Calescibacterium sp.]|nr:Wzz/FepE/Etk N-terminal domain-containing protein [Candidatus Calescibacterium sp.]